VFGLFVPLYFGPFGTVSSLNLMMRSSPARSRKKMDSTKARLANKLLYRSPIYS
jgi:hypothetical protein